LHEVVLHAVAVTVRTEALHTAITLLHHTATADIATNRQSAIVLLLRLLQRLLHTHKLLLLWLLLWLLKACTKQAATVVTVTAVTIQVEYTVNSRRLLLLLLLLW
jgi:hypothetical protein